MSHAHVRFSSVCWRGGHAVRDCDRNASARAVEQLSGAPPHRNQVEQDLRVQLLHTSTPPGYGSTLGYRGCGCHQKGRALR